LFGRTQTGRPFLAMGFEPGLFVWPPLRLAWIERVSSYRSVSLSRWFSHRVSNPPLVEVSDGVGVDEMGRSSDRLDVHRDFCVVAICEDGEGPLRGLGVLLVPTPGGRLSRLR
jgi:hypothetical protein